jgi:HEAT repeat protein
MSSISPHTRTLIEQLHQLEGVWQKLSGRQGDVAILTAIGDSNEPASIVHVLPFVLATQPEVATAAAMAVHKLVLASTTKDLVWLDGGVRQLTTYGELSYEWFKLYPDQLNMLERFGSASASLFGIASFHRSGYVREAAIKRLDETTSGDALPFLILRLNDWVSNVREVAYQTIRARLRPEYARHFVATLTLVSRLEVAGRVDHKELLDAINEFLQGDEGRSALLESLTSGDRFLRRASFRIILKSPKSDLPQIVRNALLDQDSVIRLWAAQTVSLTFEGATLDSVLQLMKRDRFMPVRREALRISINRNSPGLSAELRAALLDSHTSLREEARYYLSKLDSMDVPAFYRQSLATGDERTLYSAISGLGETGSAADDQFILPYPTHQVGRVRRAAIKALAKLHGAQHIDVFTEGLKDETPHVSRQALKALSDKVSSIRAEQLWQLFSLVTHAHVRRNALALMMKLSKWDSIHFMVRALCDSDDDITGMSRFGIERWLARFNRSFSSPTREQLARLDNALNECGDLLDEKTRQQLRFSMKSSSASLR